MADPKVPTQTNVTSRTPGEIERSKRTVTPAGRGVPDERHTFAQQREENLEEGRQPAAQIPRDQFQGDPDSEEQETRKDAASDTFVHGEQGAPHPRE